VSAADERPDSLAAQAASWVPPWEREQRPVDREYQAAAADPDISDEVAPPEDLDGPLDVTEPDDDEDRSAASLSEDDDDFDESFEGPNPPGYGEVPAELPPLPGESDGPATVDAPADVSGETEAEPTDVGGEPEVPLPESIESAAADAEDDELGLAVDAPSPPEGDDAGEVFDAAADDDVSDDAEVDLPISEVVPGPDEDEALGAVDAGGGAVLAAFSAGQADAGAAFASGAAPAERAKPRSAVPAQGRGTGRPGVAGGQPDGRTEKDLTPGDGEPAADGGLAPMDDAELRAALEAILLVVDEPVAEMQLAQIMEQPTERVGAMLEDISARYTAAGHGFDLRRAAGGWRLYTRPEYAPYVERFVLDGQSVRLTQASLETLAVVAYKQPVTRSRISAIRGVNCDGVMRTLVTRGLIEECGTESETGAYLYRTTPLFLEKLGLNSVDQLPPLAPFLPDDVEEVLDASG
jgi:segregation and condensation protein B